METNSSIRKWFGKGHMRNFLSLTFIQIINVLIGLVATPIIFKAIGEEAFGKVNLALSIMMLLNVLVGFGFHLSGPRETSLQKESSKQLSSLFSKILTSRVLIALLVTAIILTYTFIFNAFAGYEYIIVLSLVIILAESINPLWFLMGMEKMRMLSVGNLVSKLLYLCLLILFVYNVGDARFINFFMGSSTFIVYLVILLKIRGDFKINISLPSFNTLWRTAKNNVFLFLSSFAGHVSVHSGIIILSFIATDIGLGVYSLGQKVPFVLRMIPVHVTQSVLAKASRLYVENSSGFRNLVGKAYLTTVFVTLLISLGVFTFSDWIIYFLSAGNNTSAAEILKVLAFIPFLSGLNVANMVIMLSSGAKKALFNGTWVCSFFMIIAGLIGAITWNIQGMAYALLISETVTFLVFSLMNVKYHFIETKALYSSLHKILGAALAGKSYNK